jgi:hypothetical protein
MWLKCTFHFVVFTNPKNMVSVISKASHKPGYGERTAKVRQKVLKKVVKK